MRAAWRPCATRNCPELVRAGEPCKRGHGRRTYTSHVERMESEPHRAIYFTRRWRDTRRRVLSQRPLCAECDRHGRVTLAAHVHHTVPLQTFYLDDPDRAFNESELEGLCVSCHSTLTRQEVQDRKS